MIYLVGGPPRGGKTTLARALSKEKGIPYVPVDYLMSTIYPYIADADSAEKFPLRTFREETQWSNDALYEKYTPQQVVDSYLREAETTWPGVRNFIQYALADEHHFILEGFQLLPRLVHDLNIPENQLQIKSVFLCKTDPEAILAGMKANTVGNDWAVKNTTKEGTLRAIAEMVSIFGKHIQRECEKFELEYVPMDTDFKQRMDDLVGGAPRPKRRESGK